MIKKNIFYLNLDYYIRDYYKGSILNNTLS